MSESQSAVERSNPFAMTVLSDVELLDQEQKTIFTDGRRQRIDYGNFPVGQFQRAVTAVDLEYRRTGRVPTVAEVHDSWPRISFERYVELYAFEGFRAALRSRGIRTHDDSALSMEQANALILLCDPTDKRTTAAKMRQLGLTYAVYQAWMANPAFKQELNRRTNENLSNIVPVAKNRLIANVEAGDQRAIEYSLAMMGVYSPQLAANQDAMRVVYAVLEAVQKHVADKDVLKAILADVQVAGKGFDLTHPEG